MLRLIATIPVRDEEKSTSYALSAGLSKRLSRRYYPWTLEEDNFLRNHYGSQFKDILFERMPYRSWKGIVARANQLGLSFEGKCWTQEEDEYLKENYATTPKQELIKQLRRSWSSISGRVHRLRLKRDIPFTRKYKCKVDREWSEEEKQYLIQNYGNTTKKELLSCLHRSWDAIKAQAYLFNLNRKKIGHSQYTMPEVVVRNGIIHRVWLDAEENILQTMYPTYSAAEILLALPNRDWRSIQMRAAHLQIRRESAPNCKEHIMGDILDQIYPGEKSVNRARPVWLVNSKTGRRLELDRYYPELKIAFEYNGLQHYKPIAFFKSYKGGAQERYSLQVERDQIKKELCEQRGVLLIIIKYSNSLSLNNLRQIINKMSVQCQN